jgi:6-pyruvoyltetrahydropterin/6-carboxytetrahydropterin synthase
VQAFEYRLSFFLDVAHFMGEAFDSGHPNRRVHGHTFHGEWVVVGVPDQNGFVIEASRASEILKTVVDRYDHRLLNEIEGLENPTTEMLVSKIYSDLVKLESRTQCVELYRPSVGLRVRYPASKV